MSTTEPADTFVKVLAADDLEEGDSQVVQAGLKKIALFRHEGQVYAVQNVCPHAGGSLGHGHFSSKKGVVRCPRHAWGFDVTSGDCLTKPAYCLKRYEVRQEEGWLSVGIPDDGKLL
ncbi:MAG: nitrite reductase small subunit NirD [Myxococcota bacterium]